MFLKTFRRRLLQKKFDQPRVEVFVVVGEEGVYCPVVDLVIDVEGRAVIRVDSSGFDQLRQAEKVPDDIYLSPVINGVEAK